MEQALKFTEMLRQKVAELKFEQVGNITVSIGVTMLKSDDTEESIFKRIDDALYEAKETGRNKVVYK